MGASEIATVAGARKRKRIALLTAELSEAYQAALWRGLRTEAQRHDHELVCLLGSRIDSPITYESAANKVYSLAEEENFDGLIVVASAISTYLDRAQIQRVFDSHPNLPRVSVGVPVRGATSVLVDSETAVIALTRHLVETHGRRKLAIIAGPQWHVESEQRRSAIEKTLAELGVPGEPALLVHGSFEEESGSAAVEELLARDNNLDAIFCLNDRMALGALSELQRRGIDVPDQIALAGFDGIEESVHCTPPLSTVRQPLEELGARALQEVIRLMEGSGPREATLRCEPVLRESCGCPVAAGATDTPSRGELDYLESRDRAEAERLLALARKPEPAHFLQELNRHLTRVVLRGDGLQSWERILGCLRAEAMESADRRRAAESWRMLEAAAEIVGEMKFRLQEARRLKEARRTETLRTVGLTLTEAFETPILLSRLRQGVIRLGFSEGFLVLYEGERSRLLLAEGGNSRSLEGVVFSPRRMLPEGALECAQHRIWILIPLVFQSRGIGHLVLPGDSPEIGTYETLAKQLSASLQGALLMDRVRNHEQRLEREVERRTKELQSANRSLREEIVTRTRLENEVAEISKRTMERIGQDLHDDLCQHLAGVAMHVGVLQATLEAERSPHTETVGMINELIQNSVARTKGIVRGLLPVGLKEDGLLVALRALVEGSRSLDGRQILLEAETDRIEMEEEQSLELYRIAQEALNNSIKHSGASRIEVRISELSGGGDIAPGGVRVEVRDNGRGLSDTIEEGGMGLKIMRYRAEKLGARLSIESGSEGTSVRCDIGKARETAV